MKISSLPDISRDPLADYARVERAIAFLRREAHRQPSLAEVAAAVHTSQFHLQRVFSRWAGLSPKRFLQLLTVDHAKQRLAESADLLSASIESGLSGSGRLHDLFVTIDAVTPGEFKRAGVGVEIDYGFHPSPFGECLIGQTQRGVCFFEFLSGESRATAIRRLRASWAGAKLVEAPEDTAAIVQRVFDRSHRTAPSLNLLVRGTNFQTRVWRALLNIPEGHVVSYAHVANWIGHPCATRAVGTAIGANPIAWIIPCHRVLRTTGQLGGYHWGETRKAACLAWEQATLA